MPQLEAHEIATLFPTMSTVDLDHLRASLGDQGLLEEILLFEGKILDGRHRYATCLELGVEPRFREFEGTAQDAFAYSVALNLSRRHLTTVQRAAAGAGLKEFQAKLLSGDAAALVEDEEVAHAPPAPATPRDDDDAPEAEEALEDARRDEEETPAPTAARPRTKKRQLSPRTANARARTIASERVGVSPRAIDAAAKVKQEAPDVFQRMLEGTAGSMPDVKRVTALPAEQRQEVHRLVDEGTKLKAALKQVAPPPAPAEGPVFLGKVMLEPEQARTFNAIVERRELKRAEAAREAVLLWIEKHQEALVGV
ncbi:MAG: hypothetical protein KDD82_11550 [Planctomycetes bacterium]|nr:hypothetical protein [Planctomycetota bacterium]